MMNGQPQSRRGLKDTINQILEQLYPDCEKPKFTIAAGFDDARLRLILWNLQQTSKRRDEHRCYGDYQEFLEDIRPRVEISPALRKQFNLERRDRSRRSLTLAKLPVYHGESRPKGYAHRYVCAQNIPSQWNLWMEALGVGVGLVAGRRSAVRARWERKMRKIFNPDDTPKSSEEIAEIISSPKWRFYIEMINKPLDTTGEPNTVIVRRLRQEKRVDKDMTVTGADSKDPGFALAYNDLLNKGEAIEAGWYVALNLHERGTLHHPTLYRLDLKYDETFPLGAAFPNVEERALMNLWLERRAKAEKSARDKRHNIDAARQRVDDAFDQARAIHYIRAISARQLVRSPKPKS